MRRIRGWAANPCHIIWTDTIARSAYSGYSGRSISHQHMDEFAAIQTTGHRECSQSVSINIVQVHFELNEGLDELERRVVDHAAEQRSDPAQILVFGVASSTHDTDCVRSEMWWVDEAAAIEMWWVELDEQSHEEVTISIHANCLCSALIEWRQLFGALMFSI